MTRPFLARKEREYEMLNSQITLLDLLIDAPGELPLAAIADLRF